MINIQLLINVPNLNAIFFYSTSIFNDQASIKGDCLFYPRNIAERVKVPWSRIVETTLKSARKWANFKNILTTDQIIIIDFLQCEEVIFKENRIIIAQLSINDEFKWTLMDRNAICLKNLCINYHS